MLSLEHNSYNLWEKIINTTLSRHRKKPGRNTSNSHWWLSLGKWGWGEWKFSLLPQFFGIIRIFLNNWACVTFMIKTKQEVINYMYILHIRSFSLLDLGKGFCKTWLLALKRGKKRVWSLVRSLCSLKFSAPREFAAS